jgi:glutathione S-transferase
MTLRIYGSPRSRTLRVLWAAAELDLQFEHVPLAADDPALKAEDFLRLNPAGAVPVIVDGDVALGESMAINLYLAKKHGSGGLYPPALQGEAEVWRWSLWAQGHLEPWVQRDTVMAPLHDAMAEFVQARTGAALTVLERALDGREWLVGQWFTVADLNVAGVLSPSRADRLDFRTFPRTRDWLDRCYARPAAVATRRRFA